MMARIGTPATWRFLAASVTLHHGGLGLAGDQRRAAVRLHIGRVEFSLCVPWGRCP